MRFGLVFDNVLWSKPLVSLHKLGASHAGATSEPSSPKSCEYKKFNRNRKTITKDTEHPSCGSHEQSQYCAGHMGASLTPPNTWIPTPAPINLCQLLPPPPPTTLNNKDFSNVFLPSLAYIEFRQWGLSALYSFLAPGTLNPPHPSLQKRLECFNKISFVSTLLSVLSKRREELKNPSPV